MNQGDRFYNGDMNLAVEHERLETENSSVLSLEDVEEGGQH